MRIGPAVSLMLCGPCELRDHLWSGSRTRGSPSPVSGRAVGSSNSVRGFLAFWGVLGAASLTAATANADVSSWLFVGGGTTRLDDSEKRWVPSLQLDLGMGSDPSHDFVVGGLGRTQTHFGEGTDLALLLRLATHGYVNGDWGVAVDAGAVQRWWGEGATGGVGSLNLGGPWGLGIVVTGMLAKDEQTGISAVLGIDLARLTVYRRSGANWWKNTFPAYRPEGGEQR